MANRISTALTHNTNRLQLIADSGPTMLSYIDAECRYQWINKTYEQWFSCSAKSVQGLHVRELLGEDAWAVVQPYALRALAGEVVTYEQELPLAKKGSHWLRATYTPDMDDSGKIRGFVVHAIDIGESKKAEENLLREKAFSESAINSMPGVFYLFTQQGRFIRWNKNLEDVSGYSSQEISAMSPLDFFDGEGKKTIATAIGRVFTEGTVNVEANLTAKNGKPIPYLFVGRRMFVADEPYLIGSGIDLSGRKEAEATQRATLNLLEDFDEEKAKLQLVQQATMNLLEDFDEERKNSRLVQKGMLNLLEDMHEERTQLDATQRALMNMLEDIETERVKAEQAKLQLEATNNELEAFSYSVSHDLRAPLRAVSGFAQAVEEDYAPRLDEDGKRYLGLIHENVRRMGKLIDDLLTFSRLGRQEIRTGTIDMEQLARTVFAELTSSIRHRRLQLTIAGIPPAQGDEPMMQQVLSNLLQNAIKFTRNKKSPTIEFGYLPEVDGGAYFVRDNGAGFDMKYVGKLFGVFQRLHDAVDFEGTGVGLALVHRIITRHAGRVWAEGKLDQGATFYFTLPKGGSA